MAAKDRYEPLDELGKLTVVLLVVEISLQLLYGLTTWLHLRELNDFIAGRRALPTDLTPIENLQGIAAIAFTAISLTLVVVIGRWIFRAAWNLRHLGAKRLDISPGMAVGWYFVPFANLVYPFKAMKEIWLASHDPARWREGSVGLLTLWWTLWLLSSVVGNIAFRLSLGAETLEAMRLVEQIGLVQTLLSVPLSLVFIRIVRTVGAAQQRSHARQTPPELPELPGPADPAPETLAA
jgi:hypothetical protein